MKHVDLFSGIGGFALAAKWNGIETVQFVEIDKRCREFLSKAWPGVAIHDDIKTFDWSVADAESGRTPTAQQPRRLCEYGEDAQERDIFLLTGGVPCQPASRAGKQRGKKDDRWLWGEAIRVLAEVRPTWALFENPLGIGDVGLDGILSEMAGCGYEVGLLDIPACAVDSPQLRHRYWIVAYLCGTGRREDTRSTHEDEAQNAGRSKEYNHQPASDGKGNLADAGYAEHKGRATQAADHDRCSQERKSPGRESASCCRDGAGHMADATETRRRRERQSGQAIHEPRTEQRSAGSAFWQAHQYLTCADNKLRRAPDDSFGLADGLHRSLLAALGNSIVPQVAAEIIGAMVKTNG